MNVVGYVLPEKLFSPHQIIFSRRIEQFLLLQCIMHEWKRERKALMNVNSMAEKLVSQCLASLPENEGPSQDLKDDTSTIGKTVEVLQDR